MKKSLIWIIIILLIAVGIFIFTNRDNVQETQSPIATPTAIPNSTAFPRQTSTPTQSPQSSVKEFILTASNFKFDIKEIKVKKNDKVRIILKATDGLHDWVIDEFNVRTKQIKIDQQDTIEFIADKTGRFQYYCSVGTHRQMGMFGNLIVE